MNHLMQRVLHNKQSLSKFILYFSSFIVISSMLYLLLLLNMDRSSQSSIIILHMIMTVLALLSGMLFSLLLFKRSSNERIQSLKEMDELLSIAHNEHEKLEEIAYTDAVTGIYNRHAFEKHFTEEWHKAISSKEALSIILVDIDHFKFFNDQFGHLVGDMYLKRVAQAILRSVKKEGHIVSRYGGDEFVVIATETDYLEALVIAEHIRHQVEKLSSRCKDKGCRVTVSIGISDVYPSAHQEDKESIIEQADQALYEAKYQGRNNTVVHSEEFTLKDNHL